MFTARYLYKFQMLAKEVIEDSILSHMSHDTLDIEVEEPKSQKVF